MRFRGPFGPLGTPTPQPPLLRSDGKGSRGRGAFCYPSPADTAAAQLGAGMGVHFGGWGPWANDASGTPPQPKQRPEAWEGRRGTPPFSDPGIQRPSPISVQGGPSPPLHPLPPHPHLNCKGIWICNVLAAKGGGGPFAVASESGRGSRVGVPCWAEGRLDGGLALGREREGQGKAPCLGVESGPLETGLGGLRPGFSGLPAWVPK